MSEQIFISYRRDGGDVTAKLICEALKNHGFTVFYDFDSLQGGYFDSRIINAIEGCNDFVLVLPPHSLDRCVNEDDWVRLEIRHALECKKNIIPVLLPGFSFPEHIPNDIADIKRFNGVQFVMGYFDRAVIPSIIHRLISSADTTSNQPPRKKSELEASEGLKFNYLLMQNSYSVQRGVCTDSEIVIPNSYRGKLVTEIGKNAFSYFYILSSIYLPACITTIGKNAFCNCRMLTEIQIPENVSEIGKDAFFGCRALTSFTMTNNVVRLGSGAFMFCEALKHINISNCITNIEDGAFSGCKSLTEITIPNSVKIIGDEAFSHCTSLKKFLIPDSTTIIKNCAFDYCSSLEEVTIPAGITRIGLGAFDNCDALKHVYYKGTVSQFRVLNGDNWLPSHIKVIHCSDDDCFSW